MRDKDGSDIFTKKVQLVRPGSAKKWMSIKLIFAWNILKFYYNFKILLKFFFLGKIEPLFLKEKNYR